MVERAAMSSVVMMRKFGKSEAEIFVRNMTMKMEQAMINTPAIIGRDMPSILYPRSA